MLKNYKNALLVVVPNSLFKDYNGTGNLPSGMAFDDYLMFVRKGVLKMLVKDLVVVVVTSRSTTSTTKIENTSTTLTASDNTPPAIGNAPPAASGNAMTSDGSVLDNDSAKHVAQTLASILGSWYFIGHYVFASLGPIACQKRTWWKEND